MRPARWLGRHPIAPSDTVRPRPSRIDGSWLAAGSSAIIHSATATQDLGHGHWHLITARPLCHLQGARFHNGSAFL